MKFLLLLLLFACAHKQAPQEAPVDVVYTEETPVIVLDQEPLKREVFSTKSTLQWMKDTARIGNCVINNQAFLKEVEAFPKFTFTDKSSKEVADSLRNAKPVVLSTYRTKNPWSSVIATTWANDQTVYFNTRRNPRPMPELLNTSCHEGLGHLQGWSHGDNSPVGKEDSVPYRLGAICEKYEEKCK